MGPIARRVFVWGLIFTLGVGPVLAQPVETVDGGVSPTAPTVADESASPEGAPAPTPPPSTPANRAMSGIKSDVLGGGWVAAALLSGTANTVARSLRGERPEAAAQHAIQDLTRSEFIVGSLLAGSAGAALGAALPIPGLAKAPLFMKIAGGAAAPLALAALASTLGTNAIVLNRQGKLTTRNLLKSVDWVSLGVQTLGSLAGMSLGATLISAGLAPAFAIGAVAVVPLVGGILGSIAASQILQWMRTRKIKAAEAAAASSGASTTGPDAPAPNVDGTGRPRTGSAGRTGSSPGVSTPEVLAIDPFADLPAVETVRVR